MKGSKTCMVTGHRKIDVSKIEYVKQQLRDEIILAIENGCTHFISGFAEGADLIFADIVVELKESHSIKLEAAIPYRNRVNTKDHHFQTLIHRCDIVGIHSEKYSPACFIKRNRFMVQNAERIIAVYDGREKGGTLATMRYAHALGKALRVISV